MTSNLGRERPWTGAATVGAIKRSDRTELQHKNGSTYYTQGQRVTSNPQQHTRQRPADRYKSPFLVASLILTDQPGLALLVDVDPPVANY